MICLIISTFHFTLDLRIAGGEALEQLFRLKHREKEAHLQSSVFKLSKDLIDSIHEEGIVAYTS